MLTSENKLRRGRHVGLDFYDLLIEALIGGIPFPPIFWNDEVTARLPQKSLSNRDLHVKYSGIRS
jgi:hypothetical protein